MKQDAKQILFYIFFGVAVFAAMMNLTTLLHFLKEIIDLIFPILLGLIFAFVLNVPMTGYERILKRQFAKINYRPKRRVLHIISLLLTLISIILVIVLACTLLIPTLIDSVRSITPLIQKKWPEWLALLKSYEIDVSILTDLAASIDTKQLSGSAGNLMDSVVSAATSTISGVSNVMFGLVIAIYILLSKSKLSVQMKKILHANLKDTTETRIYYFANLVSSTYAKFLSGQCMEAIILGTLILIAFSIFRLPYAALIGFLTSIFAFVPYVGAFASCFIGAFLILLVDPTKVLLCIIVYLAVQFIENQFIYPHVVGGSVGLAPLWTLIAALIGGKLFGLPGIIFFIPLAASFSTLIRDYTNEKLRVKEQKEMKN